MAMVSCVSYMWKITWEDKTITKGSKLPYKCKGPDVIWQKLRKNYYPYMENSINNLDYQGPVLSYYLGLYWVSLHKELSHNTETF